MELGAGILTLTIVEGKLTRDTEFLGKMSPYCTLQFKDNKMKTKIHYDGGKTPKFNQDFQLEVESPSDELILRVWDQDLTTSDAVGWAKIPMSALMINKGVEDWF
jgi:Ca2+-dependent lipid-binding protein